MGRDAYTNVCKLGTRFASTGTCRTANLEHVFPCVLSGLLPMHQGGNGHCTSLCFTSPPLSHTQSLPLPSLSRLDSRLCLLSQKFGIKKNLQTNIDPCFINFRQNSKFFYFYKILWFLISGGKILLLQLLKVGKLEYIAITVDLRPKPG